MPYISITERLREVIQSERKKNKITGEEASKAINKSATYISALERGKIERIDFDTFITLFKRITDITDDEQFEKYINNLLTDLSIKLTPEELKEQKWIKEFELRLRKIPITDDIINFIKSYIEKLDITGRDLVNEINKNKELIDSDSYEDNELKIFTSADNITGWGIKLKLEDDFVDKVLNKKIRKTNYVNMLSIIYNLHLLDNKEGQIAMVQAEEFLRDNEFYTLKELREKRNEAIKTRINKNESFNFYDIEPTDLNKEYAKAFQKIINRFNMLRDLDIDYAYKVAEKLEKNLSFDLGFMMAIFKMPFYKLNNLDTEQRKSFILELNNLINTNIKE